MKQYGINELATFCRTHAYLPLCAGEVCGKGKKASVVALCKYFHRLGMELRGSSLSKLHKALGRVSETSMSGNKAGRAESVYLCVSVLKMLRGQDK